MGSMGTISNIITSDFGNWFAGLVDGEGCFLIHTNCQHKKVYYYPRFAIHMRLDDIEMLRSIQNTLGVGGIYIQRYSDRNPMVTYQVDSVKNCKVIVAIFDKYFLRSKKRREYEIWRLSVLENTRNERIYRELKELKPYNEPSETIITAPVRDEDIVRAL